jgi:lipocalin
VKSTLVRVDQQLYSWARVSGKKRDNLFILARAKNLSANQMNEILELSSGRIETKPNSLRMRR